MAVPEQESSRPHIYDVSTAKVCLLLWQRTVTNALQDFDPTSNRKSLQLYRRQDIDPYGSSDGSRYMIQGVKQTASALVRASYQHNLPGPTNHYTSGPQRHTFVRFHHPEIDHESGIQITWDYPTPGVLRTIVGEIRLLNDAVYYQAQSRYDQSTAHNRERFASLGQTVLYAPMDYTEQPQTLN